MRTCRWWVFAVGVVLLGCGSSALSSVEGVNPSGDDIDAAEALLRTSTTHDANFQRAGNEFHVPPALLKAIAYTQTRYSNMTGESEFEGQPTGFGIMGLPSTVLEKAAQLAGVSLILAQTDSLSNIRATAALLSAYATEAAIRRSVVTAWAPMVARLSGMENRDLARAFVRDGVFRALIKGVGAPSDELASSSQSLALDGEFATSEQSLSASPDYSGAVWRTAPNFTPSRSGYSPTVVIIHTCEGGYYGCQDWMASPSTQASAHYLVKEDGSEITQMVRESQRAWHIGATYDCRLNGGQLCNLSGASANNFTIGIEHAGHAAQSSWSNGLVFASTKLSCHLSQRYGIPRDRYHYVGHGQLQPYNRTDPGANWPWSSYMSQLNAHCGGGPVSSSPSPAYPRPDPRVFDAAFYINQHGDLVTAFGGNLEAATAHWYTHGQKEGRASAAGFDVRYYLGRYGDLQKAYGNDYASAIQHFLKFGLREGRSASRAFDPVFYLQQYGDLRDAFGPQGYEAAMTHWLTFGIREGRRASADFDPKYYLGVNQDVARVYGAQNHLAAIWHWLKYGINEGRRGAP